MKLQKDQNVFCHCDFLQKMKPEFVEKKPTDFRNVRSLYRMRTNVSSRKYKNFLLFEIYAENIVSFLKVNNSGRMYFSCFAKKSTKRRRLKGTFRKGM